MKCDCDWSGSRKKSLEHTSGVISVRQAHRYIIFKCPKNIHDRRNTSFGRVVSCRESWQGCMLSNRPCSWRKISSKKNENETRLKGLNKAEQRRNTSYRSPLFRVPKDLNNIHYR